MSYIDKLFYPTLVAIFAGIFLFYFQQDKPDVRYSLSQRLPLTFSVGDSSENVQLLEVKNVGKTEAQAILVKSDKKVARYEIQKNSRSDVVEAPNDNGSFEIKYATLPPGGNFKIILRSVGDGLTGNDVSISHSKGKASDAFSTGSGFVLVSIISIMFGIGGLFMFLNMKDFVSQRWESRITYDAEKVFKSSKPFFINKDKWRVINKEAWEWKLSKDTINFYGKPEESASYKALSFEKPNVFDDDAWQGICKKSSETFVSLMISKANKCYYSGQIIDLMGLEKPNNLSKDDWEKITKYAENVFSSSISDELYRQNVDELFDIISKRKIKYNLDEQSSDIYFQIAGDVYKDKLTDKINWLRYPLLYLTPEMLRYVKDSDRIQEVAYNRHYEAVSKDLRQTLSPLTFIEKTDWSVLKEEDCEELKKKAYQKEILYLLPILDPRGAEELLAKEAPSWIEDGDLKRIKKIAEDILDLEKNRKKTSLSLSLLDRMLRHISLGDDKPEILSDEEWQRLRLLDDDIVKTRRAIDVLSRRNRIVSKRISDKENKLTLQLRTINEVLNDPAAIYKIESFNRSFSSGNFENLKKVANLLSGSTISTDT